MDDKPVALTKHSNGHANPAAMRERIAHTRDEMSGTIEQLHGRLNPAVLKQQVIEQFHDAADTVKEELKTRLQDAKETLMAEFKEAKVTVRNDLIEEIDTVKGKLNDEIVQAKAAVREATIGKVENMMRSAKQVVAENPIPAALTGLGLAWLFIKGRRSSERTRPEPKKLAPRAMPAMEAEIEDEGEYATGAEQSSTADKVRDVAQQARDKVRQGGQKVSEVAHDAKESVTDIAHKARDTAADWSHRAGREVRRIKDRGDDLFRDNPIAIGAAALALGTIVGLAVPRTEREDEWIGSKRDKVMSKAKEVAHEAFQKADEAVRTAGTTKDNEGEPSEDFH